MAEHPLVDGFRRTLALLPPLKGKRLLLACSAGVDSTVLLNLVAIHTDYAFGVSHVNYRLRGADSDADEAYVRQLVNTLNADHSSGQAAAKPGDLPNVPKELASQQVRCEYYAATVDLAADTRPGESVQMAARRIRYAHFERIMEENNYDYLLTAHHADDNLETALMNIARKVSLPGSLGMPLQNGKILRPLLYSSRATIMHYARARGLNWREDRSNATDHYLRNRVRHRVMPVLGEILGLDGTVYGELSRRTHPQKRVLDLGYDTLFARFFHSAAGCITFRPAAIVEAGFDPVDLVQRRLGFRAFPEVELRRVLTAGRESAMYIGKDSTLELKDGLAMIREQRPSDAPLPAFTAVEVPDLNISVQLDATRWVEFQLVPRPPDLNEAGTQYVSWAVLALPLSEHALHLRPRQNGDRLQPLGLRGTKKLQDFLVDRKVPRETRNGVPLLVDGEGTILAVLGHTVCECARVLAAEEWVVSVRLTGPQ